MAAPIPANRDAVLSLSGIKRAEDHDVRCLKARRFRGRDVRIWSAEHRLYWRPNGQGYTSDRSEAGVYKFEDAVRRTRHCGPEKRIFYELVRGREAAAVKQMGWI